MITFTEGNLLEADVEALVNTVNTVGVMGKGIALMFKERFPDNFREYYKACKSKSLNVGTLFVTEPRELDGPRWIVNFPTKTHWRGDSRLEWIVSGLEALQEFVIANDVKSIAIPPLGAGNGGLDWSIVKPKIEAALGNLRADVLVYEPTTKYQNVAKRSGIEKLTPARALIAEMVRRYWVLGFECSLLEVQKLAWFLTRSIAMDHLDIDPLKLTFEANRFGPYAHSLTKLLDGLDGSYLHSDKRIADSRATDLVEFRLPRADVVKAFINSEAKNYRNALERTTSLIGGFESPFGMELLATVDWLIFKEHVEPNVASVREGLQHWTYEDGAHRKVRLFDEHAVEVALSRLNDHGFNADALAHH